MEMTYVKVYQDWTKATAKLRDAEKGRLIDAMVVYATTGVDTSDQLSGNEQYLFPMFQAYIDRDRQAMADYAAKQSANGSKGGRPKNPKNPPLSDENPKNPPLFLKTQKSQEKEKEILLPPNPLQGGTGSGGGFLSDDEMDVLSESFQQLLAFAEDIKLETSNRTAEELNRLAAEYGHESLRSAMEIAHDQGKVTLAYIKGILRNGVDSPPPVSTRKETRYHVVNGEFVPYTVEVAQ